MLNLTDDEIEVAYEELKEIHKNFLEIFGVKLPGLKKGKNFTEDALGLIFFYKNFDQKVTKKELFDFIIKYHPNITNAQQGRHLGA